jgi:peptidyl-dipeptidase A
MATADVSNFLSALERVIEPLSREVNHAYWDAATTGSVSAYERFAELQLRLQKVFSDPGAFEKIRRWKDDPRTTDPAVRRQLDILYDDFLRNQIDPGLNETITRLATRIENQFNVYRAELDGRKLTANDLSDIMKRSKDTELRRRAWEASKDVGAIVHGELLELVRLRNEAAQALGYDDFYAMSLDLDELNETELDALVGDLGDLTEAPFARLKEELDGRLTARYGIENADLRPWHYDDLFFQEAPRVYDVDLDGFYRGHDVVEVVRSYFERLGLEVADILERSDLYEKPGKDQHAFCIDIDRRSDIRILANVKSDEMWTGTMLHELGHAVYDKYVNPQLPFILRQHAHTFVTEAIAMLFGRLSKNPRWMKDALGLTETEIAGASGEIARYLKLGQIVFTRWAQVMIRFERALYRDPDQDLDTLWWDLVERYQSVSRPDGRNAPDWAAKSHVVSSPVYYHNYLLGELLASQIAHYLRTKVAPSSGDDGAYFAQPVVGSYLKGAVFEPGARHRWNTLVERATGEPLTPRHFVAEFAQG